MEWVTKESESLVRETVIHLERFPKYREESTLRESGEATPQG